MVNKRGYSFGPDLPFHFERRGDTWAVFDARDDSDVDTGLKEWEACALAQKKNGTSGPTREGLDAIDSTPSLRAPSSSRTSCRGE